MVSCCEHLSLKGDLNASHHIFSGLLAEQCTQCSHKGGGGMSDKCVFFLTCYMFYTQGNGRL